MSQDPSQAVLPNPPQRRQGNLYLAGEVPYPIAWRWQRQLVARYKAASLRQAASVDTNGRQLNGSDVATDSLILLQHPPVYTLGQGADVRFLRFDPAQASYEIHRVERGGEVTYHCPGQLVGYPILDLHGYRLDLHWYLRALEEVIIRALACYGLEGERIAGLTGVWVEGCKVAAVGIKVSRWITMHGFALNICPDLLGFEKIVPCGIEGRPVGSLAQFLPAIRFLDVQKTLIEQFEQVFHLRLVAMSLTDLGGVEVDL